MSENFTSPKNKTEDLADRVLDTARAGQDLTGFQKELSRLSNSEILQFTKDLNKQALDANVDDIINKRNTNHPQPEVIINKQTGKVVDIELDVHPNNDLRYKESKDIYTPDQEGKDFDRKQEIAARVAPYKQMMYLMNVVTTDMPLTAQSKPIYEVNKETVGKLLAKNTEGSPDQAELLKEFNGRGLDLNDGPYGRPEGFDSTFGTPHYKDTPKDVQDQIDRLIEISSKKAQNYDFRHLQFE